MKRLLLFTAVIFTLMGCDNKFEDVGNSRQMISDLPTLTAAFDEDATRTYVANNKYLRWHEGDLISAFIGDTRNCKYQFEGKTGDNSGTFVSVESSLGSSEKLDRIYALYPYDKSATITTKGVISCSLSAIQTYATNSFAQNVNTMVSATSGVNDGDIIFKNVGGYLKIRLYGEGTVKSIELRGNNGEKIAGNANITATYGGVPKIAMADDATESIMLDCSDGVELSADAENPTVFWVVVPPMEFSKGITIVATDINNGTFVQNTSKKVVVERNIIQPMSAVEVMFEEVAKPAYNEIWYTATEKVEPYKDNVFGAVYLSNTYDPSSKKGILTFKGDVTTIGGSAFSNCDGLTSITIPDSVTTIGNEAFYFCRSLTSVTIGDSVTTIGEGAFHHCESLTSVTIGDSVTTIGDYAFYWCKSLTSVTIPDSVTTIGDYAFYTCDSLTSVTIGDSVTTIGDEAFHNCDSLTSVTIGDSVTTIGDYAFGFCGSLTSVTIPDSVTTVGGYAFAGCYSLKEFKGKYAADNGRCLIIDGTLNSFAPAGLTEYTIPDSVTTIGNSAFSWCSHLTSVTIPDSVTTIGEFAFYDCDNLTSVTIPNNVTTIGVGAFSHCDSLKEFKGKYATDNGRCLIIDGVLNSFANDCGAAEYAIPDSVTTIGGSAFYNCDSFTSVTIGDSVTTIGDDAFRYCSSLTSVTIGDSVTTIGEYAFWSCESLTSVTIGDSVTTIGDRAFMNCKSLTSVYCKATTPPSIGYYGVFKYNANSRKIYVPTASVNDYKTAAGWCDYADYIIGYDFDKGEIATPKPANNEIWYTSTGKISIPVYAGGLGATITTHTFDTNTQKGVITCNGNITKIGDYTFGPGGYGLTSLTMPDSVTSIGYAAFSGCNNLTSVTLSNNLTTIGESAFEGCKSLTSVIIPNSVKDIKNKAFYGCISLMSIAIPDSVTTIEGRAFSGCKNLASVTIGNNVTTIGNSAFYDCDSLTSITIPDSVTNIGESALAFCDKLTSATIGNGITRIENCLFDSCPELVSITIPNSVISIGDFAFSDCQKLPNVTIPNSVTTIGEYSFQVCKDLTDLTIPDSVTSIGTRAFTGCGLQTLRFGKNIPDFGYEVFTYNSNLRTVYSEDPTPPEINGRQPFYGISQNAILYVPRSYVGTYEDNNGWRWSFKDILGYDF